MANSKMLAHTELTDEITMKVVTIETSIVKREYQKVTKYRLRNELWEDCVKNKVETMGVEQLLKILGD